MAVAGIQDKFPVETEGETFGGRQRDRAPERRFRLCEKITERRVCQRGHRQRVRRVGGIGQRDRVGRRVATLVDLRLAVFLDQDCRVCFGRQKIFALEVDRLVAALASDPGLERAADRGCALSVRHFRVFVTVAIVIRRVNKQIARFCDVRAVDHIGGDCLAEVRIAVVDGEFHRPGLRIDVPAEVDTQVGHPIGIAIAVIVANQAVEELNSVHRGRQETGVEVRHQVRALLECRVPVFEVGKGIGTVAIEIERDDEFVVDALDELQFDLEGCRFALHIAFRLPRHPIEDRRFAVERAAIVRTGRIPDLVALDAVAGNEETIGERRRPRDARVAVVAATERTVFAKVDFLGRQEEPFIERIRFSHVPARGDDTIGGLVEISHQDIIFGVHLAVRTCVPPRHAVSDRESVVVRSVGARVGAVAVVGSAALPVEPRVEQVIGGAVDPVLARAVDMLDLELDRSADPDTRRRDDRRLPGRVITAIRADGQFIVGFILCGHGPLRAKPHRGTSMQMHSMKLTRLVFSTCLLPLTPRVSLHQATPDSKARNHAPRLFSLFGDVFCKHRPDVFGKT